MIHTERWDTPLAAMSTSARAVIGPWLPRLARALGPLRAQPRTDDWGTPDGIDGLARSGSWERLLHTAWALADALPEEFLRRTTMSEHLFLRVARERRIAAPRIVAWFDTGPDQLGAPRAAQLALWMILAERARAHNGLLRFGVVQDPNREWCIETGRAGGAFLLKARTIVTPVAEHAARWLHTLEGRTDERWLIGGAHATALAARFGARALAIEEGIGDAPLRVTVDGGATVELQLPSRAALGAMLHDPWVKTQSPPRGVRAPAEPHWVVPGSAATHPVSRHGNVLIRWSRPFGRGWRRPRVHSRIPLGHAPSRYAALGRHRRRWVVLPPPDDPPSFAFPSNFAQTQLPQTLFVLPPQTPTEPRRRTWLLTDGALGLWSYRGHSETWSHVAQLKSRPWRTSAGIVAHRSGRPFAEILRTLPGAPVWAGPDVPRSTSERSPVADQYWCSIQPSEPAEPLPAPLAVRPAWPDGVVVDHGGWILCAGPALPCTLLRRPAGLQLVGGLHTDEGWSLVGLADDRRTVVIRGARDADLTPSFATVLQAWVSPRDPVLYWRDAARQVGCVDLRDGRIWLRWCPEDWT